MTVEELEGRMSARELAEWQAFDALEPIGHIRTDYGFAMLATLYANSHRRKGDSPAKITDFMPFIANKPAAKASDPEAMIAMLKSLTGGSDGDRR